MNHPEALNGPTPILDHRLNEPTAFRPEDLIEAVRQQRGKGTRRYDDFQHVRPWRGAANSQ